MTIASRSLHRLLVSLITLLLGAGWLPARAAVVLQYHHVSESSPASTSVTPQLFRQHMDYLQQKGFEVVPLLQLVQEVRDGQQEPLSAKRVAITFDDAYSSVYTEAYPLLKERGWPFTVFVNSEPLDSHLRGFVSWDQLREMAANGATLANHSHSHMHFSRIPAGSSRDELLQQVRGDVEKAQARLKAELGDVPKLLAYPFGEHDQQVMEMLAGMGYVAFGQQSGALGPSESLQALPRFPFGGNYGDISDFAVKVKSRPLPVTAVRLAESDDRLPQLSADNRKPRVQLQLAQAMPLNCFASGQGAVEVKPLSSAEESWFEVSLKSPLGAGRNRINCTSPGPEGRFYWFSQPLYIPAADGSWPAE
ncbi:polysaccharide deacetylase family protein [Pseudomaricurvus sp. HS19]|uniref:polysaccharide deacetylase family protein n=1 Tax=Pseudomaricurvus sp. HS19 TaxID=2692626 RepID=UPI00136C5E52|nr:polysaccharide deacetylase family protein [Pseudomaricurvus sp. HS19]MYM63123.1 polysaccharide deacetylase family protein [Pseudomaricurvus sp. HS19]